MNGFSFYDIPLTSFPTTGTFIIVPYIMKYQLDGLCHAPHKPNYRIYQITKKKKK